MRWTLAVVLVLASGSLARADGPVEPRHGKYTIKSYGASNRPPLMLGYFVLEPGGKYRILLPGGREVGAGTYTFDASKKQIVWQTGTYKTDNWMGKFYVENDGKTHVVQVKGTTWAYNTPKEGGEEQK